MQPVGSQDVRSGATYGTDGGMIYNPQTGTTSRPGAGSRPPILGYEAGGVILPIRQTQR
jgi:hypothetical protein